MLQELQKLLYNFNFVLLILQGDSVLRDRVDGCLKAYGLIWHVVPVRDRSFFGVFSLHYQLGGWCLSPKFPRSSLRGGDTPLRKVVADWSSWR
ncbi:hypothetical protein V1509DRAFT_66726 [Lipomyces kononenkoae]